MKTKKYIVGEANDYHLRIREDFGYTNDKKTSKKNENDTALS